MDITKNETYAGRLGREELRHVDIPTANLFCCSFEVLSSVVPIQSHRENSKASPFSRYLKSCGLRDGRKPALRANKPQENAAPLVVLCRVSAFAINVSLRLKSARYWEYDSAFM